MKKLLPLLLAFAALYWWSQDPSVDVTSGDGVVGYVVEYSGDHGDGDRLPMIVALHGNGDTAGNFHDTALGQVNEPARIVLLKGPLSYAGGDAWPWTEEALVHHGSAVAEAVQKLSAKYPTTGKPVLLGFSGGAGMAYYQAVRHGPDYSRIIPVSGSLAIGFGPGDPAQPSAPVFAFHGRTDSVIPFLEGQLAARALEENGIEVTFTEFGGGHLDFFGVMNASIIEVLEQGLRNVQ